MYSSLKCKSLPMQYQYSMPLRIVNGEAGKMAQRLEALATLPKDLS